MKTVSNLRTATAIINDFYGHNVEWRELSTLQLETMQIIHDAYVNGIILNPRETDLHVASKAILIGLDYLTESPSGYSLSFAVLVSNVRYAFH